MIRLTKRVRSFDIAVPALTGSSSVEIAVNHNMGAIPDHIEITIADHEVDAYREYYPLWTGGSGHHGWILAAGSGKQTLSTTTLTCFRYASSTTDMKVNLFFMGGRH
jgi:hypothetical protein